MVRLHEKMRQSSLTIAMTDYIERVLELGEEAAPQICTMEDYVFPSMRVQLP